MSPRPLAVLAAATLPLVGAVVLIDRASAIAQQGLAIRDAGAPTTLVRFSVSGRHTRESLSVDDDGAFTVDIADDGSPVVTGTLPRAEFARVRAAIAATAGIAPPHAPSVLMPESAPVVSVTTQAASASSLQGAAMRGPWGVLATRLAASLDAHRPVSAFTALLTRDATALTLTNRTSTSVPACFALVTETLIAPDGALVRAWNSSPLEPGATADELAHGPHVARCTPTPRAPGWSVTIPLGVRAPLRGESL